MGRYPCPMVGDPLLPRQSSPTQRSLRSSCAPYTAFEATPYGAVLDVTQVRAVREPAWLLPTASQFASEWALMFHLLQD